MIEWDTLVRIKRLPTGWIEQPTSPLRVARSTTELNGHIAGEKKPSNVSMGTNTPREVWSFPRPRYG